MRIRDVLLPVEISPASRAELLRRIGSLQPPLAIAVQRDEAGEALARSLLFEHWPELATFDAIDARTRLYNQYFWFRRFAVLWQAANGMDAGLEQQAFKMLEHAEVDLDGALLEEIDQLAAGR
jgi:hypothetical protein